MSCTYLSILILHVALPNSAAALLVILDPQLLPEFARYADAGDADVRQNLAVAYGRLGAIGDVEPVLRLMCDRVWWGRYRRSEGHTSEIQSPSNLVCRLLVE